MMVLADPTQMLSVNVSGWKWICKVHTQHMRFVAVKVPSFSNNCTSLLATAAWFVVHCKASVCYSYSHFSVWILGATGFIIIINIKLILRIYNTNIFICTLQTMRSKLISQLKTKAGIKKICLNKSIKSCLKKVCMEGSVTKCG